MAKTFARDHIVRDKSGSPLGRMVLVGDYKADQDQYQVALLKIPRAFTSEALGMTVFVDEVAYKVPDDLPVVKITHSKTDIILNSFILTKA
mgnify:CR=1 FL=1